MDKYLDFSDEQIDSLLFEVNLDSVNNTEVSESTEEAEEIEKTNKEELKCISCKGVNLIFNDKNGSFDCTDCGVVNSEIFDKNPEFSQDGLSSRYGCPTNYFFPQSALGTRMKTNGYNPIAMLQRQNHMPYKEKSLMIVLQEIQQKCKDHGITKKTMDGAKLLYKKIRDCKHKSGTRKGKAHIMRCLNRRSMIAACVFYACKLQNELRSPREIADIYDLELRNINRGCKKFLEYIDIEPLINKFKSSQSFDFIERFAEELKLEKKYIQLTKDISQNIHKLDLASTHEPPSVAAGCILLVVNNNNLRISKKKISEVFKISDVTIAKTYRRINPYYAIVSNNEITELILEKKKKIQKNKINITMKEFIVA